MSAPERYGIFSRQHLVEGMSDESATEDVVSAFFPDSLALDGQEPDPDCDTPQGDEPGDGWIPPSPYVATAHLNADDDSDPRHWETGVAVVRSENETANAMLQDVELRKARGAGDRRLQMVKPRFRDRHGRIERQCAICGEAMPHELPPVRDAVNTLMQNLAEQTGRSVEDLYPTSQRGRRTTEDPLQFHVARLAYEGYTQRALAGALSRDGEDKTNYVNRSVAKYREIFPKIAKKARGDAWFPYHIQTKHPELVSVYASRPKKGFVLRADDVLRLHPTEIKTVRVGKKLKQLQDYDPRESYRYALGLK